MRETVANFHEHYKMRLSDMVSEHTLVTIWQPHRQCYSIPLQKRQRDPRHSLSSLVLFCSESVSQYVGCGLPVTYQHLVNLQPKTINHQLVSIINQYDYRCVTLCFNIQKKTNGLIKERIENHETNLYYKWTGRPLT